MKDNFWKQFIGILIGTALLIFALLVAFGNSGEEISLKEAMDATQTAATPTPEPLVSWSKEVPSLNWQTIPEDGIELDGIKITQWGFGDIVLFLNIEISIGEDRSYTIMHHEEGHLDIVFNDYGEPQQDLGEPKDSNIVKLVDRDLSLYIRYNADLDEFEISLIK